MSLIIAVTGATGFIGSRFAQRLGKKGRVRALVRDPRRAQALSRQGVDIVPGSLQDRSSLRQLVAGSHVVIHCAGATRGAGNAHFHSVNVEGTAELAAAAAEEASNPLFVQISSLAAREPALSDYAATKRHSEEALAARQGLRWVILRPPPVYGPGDRELTPLFQWMMRGIAPILGPRDARFSMLYVDDLAEAVARLMDAPGIEGRIFELHDGYTDGYTWDKIIDIVARMTRRQMWRIPVPGAPLHAVAALNRAVASVLGYQPMFTPGKVRELRHHDWMCDNSQITESTGWSPQIIIEQGLRLTLGLGAASGADIHHRAD